MYIFWSRLGSYASFNRDFTSLFRHDRIRRSGAFNTRKATQNRVLRVRPSRYVTQNPVLRPRPLLYTTLHAQYLYYNLRLCTLIKNNSRSVQSTALYQDFPLSVNLFPVHHLRPPVGATLQVVDNNGKRLSCCRLAGHCGPPITPGL